MIYSQKYTIVAFNDSLREQDQFHMADWPIHITLADTFAIDRFSTDIDNKLRNFAHERKSLTITATECSILGSTPVLLMGSSTQLKYLHEDLISILEENGAVFITQNLLRRAL